MNYQMVLALVTASDKMQSQIQRRATISCEQENSLGEEIVLERTKGKKAAPYLRVQLESR